MIKVGMYINDRYEIIDKVGSGGMADVYKAKCHRLNRYVAIKVLKAEYSSDKNFVSKFRNEAQSAAGLSHPNIVNVYDVGEDNGLYYIVMELVEGITLKRFIERKGHLEIKEAVGISIQIAQGMEAAHANHIIHRDIKPQNIIISREGKVKVTDFGIAKAATSNTVTQNAIGSVHYLSPEQARGGYSDERSDIYSLGVTLYEMLTGRVPFAGDNTVSVALLHIQGEATPVRELNPSVSVSLDKIVQKCMQKKQERRYQSASELIQDLKSSINDPNGDFVHIASGVVTESPTRKMTDRQMKEIETAARTQSTIYSKTEQSKPKKIREEDDELDSMDSRIEKALTIGSIVAVIIVGIAVLYVIANFFHLFDFLDPEKKGTLIPTSPPQMTSTPTPTISPTPTPELVDMPYVIGLTAEDAVMSLDTISTKFTVIYEEDYSEEHEAGKIMKQYPNSGASISKTMTITLTVSSGPEPVKLPNVYNLSLSEAKETLSSKGWNTTVVEYQSSSIVAAGCVISTLPERFEIVEQGSRIVLYVSTGAEKKSVPNLLGKTVDEAKLALTEAGLTAGTVESAYSDTIAAGLVCSQSTVAEAQLDVGAVVNIYVSMGPNPNPSPTPSPSPSPAPTDSPNPEDGEGGEGEETGDTPVVNPEDGEGEGSGDTPVVNPEGGEGEGSGDTPVVNPEGGEGADGDGEEGGNDAPVVNPDDEEEPQEPTPTPTPVGELKYRGTVAITEFPFSDSAQVVDVTLELVQGDVMIPIYDEFGITEDDFMMDLASFSFALDDKRLSAGEANVYMYIDLIPSETVYTVTLEEFYE